jgi:UDP-glucuronate 4-epimerase
LKVLVTGSAGFIGFHTVKYLLERGDSVVGFDNINNYYDVTIKQARLKALEDLSKLNGADYQFINGDIGDKITVTKCFKDYNFDRVINLAAQAGVRYSLENPQAYVDSNIIGFTNILEACRYFEIEHLTYASTSSVYGANMQMPFSETQGVDHPLQFYAATKKANELMAHSYSHLFKLPTTGLRFFTVYGPWGRPDMALFLFTKNILDSKPIKVFNNGNHTRDFTYVDDIVRGLILANDKTATPDNAWDSFSPDPSTSNAPYRIFNIGNSKPIRLMDYIKAIETSVGLEAKIDFLPLQPGDVPDTFSDTSSLEKWVGYKPTTSVEDGVSEFVKWYKSFYR